MEEDVRAQLSRLEAKIDAVFVSAEKTRTYFLAVLVVTLIAFVLPLIGLLFALPSFLSVYTDPALLGL
jgi:hypothetical protein